MKQKSNYIAHDVVESKHCVAKLRVARCFLLWSFFAIRFAYEKSPYSFLRLFTGFAVAALIAWTPTVRRVITSASTAATMKTTQLTSTR